MLRKSGGLSGRTIWSALICALLILITSGRAQYGTILLYHRFGDDRYPTTSVSLEDFERQMSYLKEEGYRVVPLSRLVDMIRKGKIPPKTVAITIDDGYGTTMKAFAVLRKFGYPFTVFLYMEAVGRYPDFLSVEDLKELMAYGALPFGYYNRQVIDVLKSRGYTAVFTQDPGNVDKHTELYRIPRQAIVGSWSRMENFRKKLEREPLPLKDLLPDYGFLRENPPKRIGALLLFPERYVDCRIYVTELGWKIAQRQGALVFREEIPFLRRKWNRIGVKCRNRETGRWAESFWMVAR